MQHLLYTESTIESLLKPRQQGSAVARGADTLISCAWRSVALRCGGTEKLIGYAELIIAVPTTPHLYTAMLY
jgi:hypothetical protein